jgi:endo-1,3(4)-beta-glucanase
MLNIFSNYQLINRVLAGPFPFQTVTRNSGLEFGLSYKREFDGVSIIQHTQLDWNAGFAGLPDALNNRKITAWDTQVVCMQYFANGATMDTCLVHGAPYMTFTYSNAVILLKSVKGDVTGFEWVVQGSLSSKESWRN